VGRVPVDHDAARARVARQRATLIARPLAGEGNPAKNALGTVGLDQADPRGLAAAKLERRRAKAAQGVAAAGQLGSNREEGAVLPRVVGRSPGPTGNLLGDEDGIQRVQGAGVLLHLSMTSPCDLMTPAHASDKSMMPRTSGRAGRGVC